MDFSQIEAAEVVTSLIVGLGTIYGFIAWSRRANTATEKTIDQSMVNNQTVEVNVNTSTPGGSMYTSPASGQPTVSVETLKQTIKILFIDDDKNFKIVGILKKMGWVNTKLVKDVKSLEDQNISSADILFVDIQGVGKLMQLKDEGLGLVVAIRKRHPQKKIVIYSAQENGKRFHEAMNEADYVLPKTAEPVRFEDTIIRVLQN